jgi:hypothetical protein
MSKMELQISAITVLISGALGVTGTAMIAADGGGVGEVTVDLDRRPRQDLIQIPFADLPVASTNVFDVESEDFVDVLLGRGVRSVHLSFAFRYREECYCERKGCGHFSNRLFGSTHIQRAARNRIYC